MSRTTVKNLLDQVKKLPPGEAEQFAADYAQWRTAAASDEQLIAATRAGMPPAADARLRRLAAKSEEGGLTAEQRQQYQQLAQEAELASARRILSLAELARRWGKPVEAVMQEVGWEPTRHGA